MLEYVIALPPSPTEVERLRDLRDCAFLLILADTGLRVHEACKLRRADLDWNGGRANVIGKGKKQAVVRFSKRALKALKAYLNARGKLDGATGRPLSALPLFARHDKGAGKKVRPITTTTGRTIVKEHVKQFLGADLVGQITPHSFRHYFVTSTLRATGNLAIAQRLARHENIQVTEMIRPADGCGIGYSLLRCIRERLQMGAKMIELSFRDFHDQKYGDDPGYCLYIIKNGLGDVLYIGISDVDVWTRWLGCSCSA